MEWIYLAGSVASLVSVLAVVLGLAWKRQAITEKGFKMLFSLMVTIGLVGIGVMTMILSTDTVMRNFGGTIAVIGTFLLCIIVVMVVYYSGEEKGAK